jgi:hypothetical protein
MAAAEDMNSAPQRPRDLAVLLLAISGEAPRQRARDQQADVAGDSLRCRVLNRLAALDPEPEAVEETLAAIVAEFGEPSGPTRGVCSLIYQEWIDSRTAPGFWAWLLAEAIGRTDRPPRRGRPRAAE